MGRTVAKLLTVFGDAERPARVRAQQEVALRAYMRREVYPYSAFNRARLIAANLGPGGVRRLRDLARIPPVLWSEVGDGADLVLRPQRVTVTRLGNASFAFRVLFARLLRRGAALNRYVIDPVYRPIHWLMQQGVAVGMSANDLERLSEIGRRWLEAAGVQSADVIVSVLPEGSLDFWQLAGGARRAGVSSAFMTELPSLEDLVALAPTVLAGRADTILALARAAGAASSPALENVHTVLAVAEPLDDDWRAAITRLLGADVTVLGAWAPSGVRALWAECRGGEGYHTWPAAEIVEIVDPETLTPVPPGTRGEVVWTALGWAGTVTVRLRTGLHAVLDDAVCEACGRTNARLFPVKSSAPFETVLDAHPGVALWQGELRSRNGDDELVVFVSPARPGHPARLIYDLDARLRRTRAPAQFVILQPSDLEKRLAAHNHQRIVDLRAGS